MKILMIGGTGTISYDATKYFLSCGHDVYLFNRGNRNTIQDLRLHYITGDANDRASLCGALADQEFDVIFDFLIFNANQMKMRMDAYEGKCRQFVFISSATAYKLVDEVITEETPLENHQWGYAHGKIECEEFLVSNIDRYSFDYTIVRPYITYDARRLPFPVVSKRSYYSLVRRLLDGKPVIICGDGNNRLTLTHTTDFAVALEGLLLNPKALGQAFHITGNHVTTWNEILGIVCSKLNITADVVYIPISELAELFPSERLELLYDKSRDHVYDNSKIVDAVPQFRCETSVEEGIGITVDTLLRDKSLQRIDRVWDCTVDAIIEKYEHSKGKVDHKAPVNSRIMYYIYQKSNLKLVQKVLNRIRRMKGEL